MPSATERLRGFGLRVKQEILPNTADEARDRAQIASLVGYASGVFGIITARAELLNISRALFIPGVGGVVYMIAMIARGGKLRREEQDEGKNNFKS